VRIACVHGCHLLETLIARSAVVTSRAFNNATISAQQTGRFDPSYSGPGSQPLTVFPKISQGGLLTNATIVNLIQTGQVGNLAHMYQTNLLNGGVNFYRNPLILGANLMTNYSNATYNALQIDFRNYHKYSGESNWSRTRRAPGSFCTSESIH
jgi:hypothetical protein